MDLKRDTLKLKVKLEKPIKLRKLQTSLLSLPTGGRKLKMK